MYIDYREAILKALTEFNTAYGRGVWKGDRGAILDMAREVYWELHDPRILLFARVMAKLDCIANFIYGEFQVIAYLVGWILWMILFALLF